jgi:hypothetical protein
METTGEYQIGQKVEYLPNTGSYPGKVYPGVYDGVTKSGKLKIIITDRPWLVMTKPANVRAMEE